MKKNEKPVIVEQIFVTSPENVWRAITEPDQMRQWYFENIPSFKAEPGFETKFNVKSNTRNFLHLWKVTRVIPLKMISYNWKYEGYKGDSHVSFELFTEKNKVKLRLMHQVLEDFQSDIPEFSRSSCLEGWNFFIKERLKGFLQNKYTNE